MKAAVIPPSGRDLRRRTPGGVSARALGHFDARAKGRNELVIGLTVSDLELRVEKS